MDRLVRTDVKELNLLFRCGQTRSLANFRVENLMHTMSVAVSMCTTNPHAFTIKPSPLYIIPPLSSATFSLSTTVDSPSGTERPILSFPQDKLSIKSTMLPTGKADEDQLNALFSEPGNHVYNDASISIAFAGEDAARSIISWEHRHLNELSASVLLAKAVSVCTPSQMAELLRLACRIGRTQFVSTLIDAGADVNCRDALGISALALAVNSGNGESIRVLLSAGAAVDPSVRKFLHSADSLSRVDIVSAFVSARAFDVNGVIDSLGRTPLHLCAIHGNLDTLSFCVASGGDVDSLDLNGWTPLHYAAAEGHLDTVTFLLDVCDAKYSMTHDRKTPQTLAMESGHHHILDRLYVADMLFRTTSGHEGNVFGLRESVPRGHPWMQGTRTGGRHSTGPRSKDISRTSSS